MIALRRRTPGQGLTLRVRVSNLVYVSDAFGMTQVITQTAATCLAIANVSNKASPLAWSFINMQYIS
mgnify:CR=1 FL=1